ncbi:MAG: restriction endonuclease subunit S, partial [Gallionellaceae bacterium]
MEITFLPSNWSSPLLGEICKTTSGGTPSRGNKGYYQGEIPWVKSGELPDGIINDVQEHITQSAISNSSAKLFPKGSLLIALYGATIGKLGVLNFAAASNQAVCAIFPQEGIEQKYLFWYLLRVRSDLIKQAIGGAQPNISQGILRSMPVPVAPIDQQKQIVEEIEKQFSRLDKTVADLKRVKANLKRYKASVVQAAVTGKLTEAWRKQHHDVEPASKLLERILTERRQKWEETELAKLTANGKTPKNDK